MPAREQTPQAPLCFVIGPIGKADRPERKHADFLLHSVIKHVLEAEEFGYRVKRGDEDADPGMIGDRAISDIIHADLVVADLTDLNPNAFYELGIRHSTLKPTIHVAKADMELPFDNASHRTIFIDVTDWHSIEAGRSRLAQTARAIKEPNYRVSNPITQAKASFEMRESADPRDRVIADLQERISRLETRGQNLMAATHPARQVALLADVADLITKAAAANMSPDGIEQLVLDYFGSHGEPNIHIKMDKDRKVVDIMRPDGGLLHLPIPAKTTVNYSNLSRPPGI
jgi:hypothetical protein